MERAVIEIPASKSLSHRAVICAALAGGHSRIENLGRSMDIQATQEGMAALAEGRDIVDCKESGSTLRFLLPIAAARGQTAVFTGQGRLMARPAAPYETVFAAHGASLVRDDGKWMVQGKLRAGRYTLPGDVSSQFISGLLFALPLLEEESEILLSSPLQSAPYVDLTIACLRDFGVSVTRDGYTRFAVSGGQRYQPRLYHVEGDYSQAAFFLAAGALGAEAECRGLRENSLQGDRRIIDIIRACGAEVRTTEQGGLIASGAGRTLSAQKIDVSDIPDLVPPLAVLLCFCQGESELYNAARLRYKESDRLSAVTRELNALGGCVTECEDSLRITGVPELLGGAVRAWGDHRIAMMAAVASLRCREPVTVDEPACVAKSYPDFWRDFQALAAPGRMII